MIVKFLPLESQSRKLILLHLPLIENVFSNFKIRDFTTIIISHGSHISVDNNGYRLCIELNNEKKTRNLLLSKNIALKYSRPWVIYFSIRLYHLSQKFSHFAWNTSSTCDSSADENRYPRSLFFILDFCCFEKKPLGGKLEFHGGRPMNAILWVFKYAQNDEKGTTYKCRIHMKIPWKYSESWF